MQQTLPAYDLIPYPGDPIRAMHPDRLAVLGRLFGLDTASPKSCRVLELGCCDGGHLIPLALAYPNSHFVGLDLSRRQIEQGRQEVAALGLRNLDLRHASILDVDSTWGAFDYLMCHGVYSWVPSPVQARILSLAREHLTPQGVAYISYNTFPGWSTGLELRTLLLQGHSSDLPMETRLHEARQTLAFLRDALAGDASPHGRLMLEQVEILCERPDHYLIHEYLEERNEPVWFEEFARRAKEAGLQFLAEAHLATMEVGLLSTAQQDLVRRCAADGVSREQCLDILRNRTFRQTLLCQREIALYNAPDATALLGMSVSSEASRIRESPPDSVGYQMPGGSRLTTRDQTLAGILSLLEQAYPASVSVSELRSTFPQVTATLLPLLTRGFVEAHLSIPALVTQPGECPLVSPWTRRQIQRGSRVTDLRHRLIELDDTERILVPYLDGAHRRADLVARLEADLASGKLLLSGELPQGENLRAALAEVVEVILRNLARLALLTDASV